MGAYAAAAGLVLGGIGAALHKSVKVPDFTPVAPVDLTKSQASAIAGNLANAPAAESLASRTTMFNTEQIKKMLVAMDPNYAALSEGVGKNILAGLRGEIAPEDTAALMSRAASKAVGGGYSGSGMERNLKARDLGLTQYQITQNALNSAQRWMAQIENTAAPAYVSSASMFMTPSQRAGLDITQRGQDIGQNQFGWQAASLKAQQTAKDENVWSDWLSGIGGSLLGGGMMGMAGGGGGGGVGSGGSMPLMISTASPMYGTYNVSAQPQF